MKGHNASRVELFAASDRPALKPLPDEPYAFDVWKRRRVAPDYHVETRLRSRSRGTRVHDAVDWLLMFSWNGCSASVECARDETSEPATATLRLYLRVLGYQAQAGTAGVTSGPPGQICRLTRPRSARFAQRQARWSVGAAAA